MHSIVSHGPREKWRIDGHDLIAIISFNQWSRLEQEWHSLPFHNLTFICLPNMLEIEKKKKTGRKACIR
jgi:hypothetical protein